MAHLGNVMLNGVVLVVLDECMCTCVCEEVFAGGEGWHSLIHSKVTSCHEDNDNGDNDGDTLTRWSPRLSH